MHKSSLWVLRAMLACLLAMYAVTQYFQWYGPDLSAEAEQYQQIVSISMSGLNLNYGVQKLCWVVGNAIGMIGICLIFFRNGKGLPMLIAAPALLSAAALLGMPPAAYPGTSRMIVTLLWCVSSAAWGTTVTYALIGKRTLFSRGISEVCRPTVQ